MSTPFTAVPQLRLSPALPLEMACEIVARKAERWIRKHLGCSRREMHILLAINDARLNQKEVGALLRTHPNTIVKQVDALEKRGYVKRVRPLDNRREYLLERTKEGKRAVEKMVQHHAECWEDAFEPLTAEQRILLVQLSFVIITGEQLP